MNTHEFIHRRLTFIILTMLFAVSSSAVNLPPCIRSAGGNEAGETPGQKDLGQGTKELAKDAFYDALDDIGGQLMGKKLDALDDLILDPIETIMENPADHKSFEKLLGKIGEGGLKVFVPGAGVVIEGTRAGIGGSTFFVSEILNEQERAVAETRIFGKFGYINDLMANDPFFGGGVTQNRGLTPQNIAQKVTSEQQLNDLWFKYYKQQLLSGPMGLTQNQRAEVDKGLQEGWAILQNFWRLKRTEIVLESFQQAMARRAKEMLEKRSAGGEGEKSEIADLSGAYKINSGVNPPGSRRGAYPGEVTMKKLRDVYEIKWTITDTETYYGIGIQVDNVLAVGFGSTDYGAAVYRICEGKLSGLWSHKSMDGVVGTEEWAGPANLKGTYTITKGQTPVGKPYGGTVSVKPNGAIYDVYWKLSNGEEHRGVAIKFTDLFIVGWARGDTGANVVNYLIEPNLLKGQWAVSGKSSVGTELLSR